MSTKTLTFTRTVKAAPAEVYHAFTNSTLFQQWLCNGARIINRDDGPFSLTWNSNYYVAGHFTERKENEKVAFTWHGRGEPGTTQVTVTFKAEGKNTVIKLEHSGLGAGDEWSKTVEESQKGWESSLENLQSVLETGIDLRFARQPMLGVFPAGPIDADIAKKLGVPVAEGIQISGAGEGTGAAEAGLQEDDVLYSIDGTVLKRGGDIPLSMGDKRAGDEVELVFYRGNEKHTIMMKLSGRPQPELPESPAALAKQIEAGYKEVDAELDKLVEGVTEEEASHSPAEGEWNAKEALAHLIWTERYIHFYLWGLVGGDGNVPFPDNNIAQILAITGAHPTLADLVAEMKRAEVSTVAIINGLPDEFLKRKGSYLQVAQLTTYPGAHARIHFAQMQAAIDDARK